MIESKRQIEFSDVILTAMSTAGGKMERSVLTSILSDKYNYDNGPVLQLEQMILTEGLIAQKGCWLFLTKEGQKAAKRGYGRYITHRNLLDRLKENRDIVSYAAGIGTLIGTLLTILAQCS